MSKKKQDKGELRLNDKCPLCDEPDCAAWIMLKAEFNAAIERLKQGILDDLIRIH